MSNTWGQGAVNNTIGWGQGAKNNTLNWGESQKTSWAGQTNITGTPSTPPFSNTQSILLDGVDDYVNVADNNNLSFGNGTTDSPFSISSWVKMDTDTNFAICSKYSTTSIIEYQFTFVSGGRLMFRLFDNASTVRIGRMTSDISANVGSWTNLVATYDGSSTLAGLKIYVNGIRADVTDSAGGSYTSMHNTTAPFAIGKYATNYADGLIDETAVFNSELSQSDVTSIYGGGNPSSLSSYSSLVSWWRCGDGDTAPILTDNGSGGNDGTMTNFTTFSTDVPT